MVSSKAGARQARKKKRAGARAGGKGALPPLDPRPPRVVVVGDLNGAVNALEQILRGTGLTNARGNWIGGRAELVQMGDLFNRGGGARRAVALLMRLRRQAERQGGKVTVLLGNHEAMTALRHEAYCTEEEYLSFATSAERRAWPARTRRAMTRLLRAHGPNGPILPLEPRLAAWKISHVPGQAALRRAFAPGGRLGKWVRSLPVVYRTAGCVFVHGGLLPAWAELGIDAVNAKARAEWSLSARFIRKLPKSSLFRATSSPLWERSLVRGGRAARAQLAKSLRLCGAARMIVGHTRTEDAPGGALGKILLRHAGRLVLVDIGLGSEPWEPRAALVIEGNVGREWTPTGTRVLWRGARTTTAGTRR